MEKVFAEHPDLAVWVISVCGFLISILTGSLVYMAKRKFKKMDDFIDAVTQLQVQLVTSEGNIKDYIAERFVTKEVCQALHKSTLDEVKKTINGGGKDKKDNDS